MGAIEDFAGYVSKCVDWIIKSERDAVRIYEKGWFWAIATIIIILFFLLLYAGLKQA